MSHLLTIPSFQLNLCLKFQCFPLPKIIQNINSISSTKIFAHGDEGRISIFFLIELENIQKQFWKAVIKSERPKISSSPEKMLSKNQTYCLCQQVRQNSYYKRNTPVDFEGSVLVSFLIITTIHFVSRVLLL